MKTCFPARKKNGENYATLDEMMALIGQEPHGSWLAGTNNMWHGGIHISEISAPGSVLKPNMTETAVPLQCMADGEVVAWRLNKDYQRSTYLEQPVQYTTTFVLVKSTCLPDKGKEQTQLDFYSLYMGLAPLSAFEKRKCMVAQKKVIKREVGKYESSRQSGDAPHAPRAIGRLPKGARILILEETEFLNKPVSPKARPGTTELQPFGLAQAFDKNGKLTEEKFWVTLLPGYMTEEGEQYAHLPFWMQKAVEQGIFDAVTKPATALKISAGDAIGFLGEDIAPMGKAKTSRSTYAHIEVLSTDSRMPAFLDNPGKVTAGRKYIRVHPTAKLYTLSGGTFSNTGNPVEKDRHIILPVDKCNPKKSGGKIWYQVGQSYWLSQDDVDLIVQYNLKELGFTALAEETTPDMLATLKEAWMKTAFGRLAEQVRPERGIREQQMSSFYKGMLDKMDTDKDGQLSERELFAALQHPEMGVRDIVARMIVKHQSEWFGGSSHQKWTAFFQNYDILRIGFVKKWLDDMEWMSQVEPFSSGQAVWHMHPVMFLSYFNNTRCDCEKLYADKFKVTRYGRQYGPVYWGEISLATYSRWDKLIADGSLTSDEKLILVAMSENEGKMDAIQSYDSEVITAGAMQKTVKNQRGLEGRGELSAQFAKFRDMHPFLYQQYAVTCGWSVDGDGMSAVMYYCDSGLTNNEKITSKKLKELLRQGCEKSSYGHPIYNKPLAALLKVIKIPEYLDIQVIDFVERLHKAESEIVTSSGKRIRDFVKSKFGRAVVLDHSVNRPSNVGREFKEAIENFHGHNPSVSLDPTTWGDSHANYEQLLLDEYKSTRKMTNSVARFNALKAKL
ncbi:TPA: hypothetical protein ACKQDZ_002580 [Serratia rubidaea]